MSLRDSFRILAPGLLQRCSCRSSIGNTAASPHGSVTGLHRSADTGRQRSRAFVTDARLQKLRSLSAAYRAANCVFSVAASRACNQLPTELELMRSWSWRVELSSEWFKIDNSFKKKLKAHFYRQAFSPSNCCYPLYFSFVFICVVMHCWTLSVVSAAIVNFNCNVM